jgi:prepilin-type N-terminal cleavage/methylation domain-containing protein/prepilin-type processing-associated H-X9-DG protein
MTQFRIRSGFSIIELLAVVGIVGIGGAFSTVAMNAGATAVPTGVRQPDEKQKKEIEKTRKELEEVKQKVKEIEGRLDSMEKGDKPEADGADKVKKSLTGSRAAARQIKDATHIRGIQQSLIVWANQHRGVYPLPSKIDVAGTTIAGEAALKDTTANIMSLLIFQGFIPVELLVSPAEANANIKKCDTYALNDPPKGNVPRNALWDPAFSADFTGDNIGNVSYAHLQPAGKRLATWSDTFNAMEATVANRGPEITSIERDVKGARFIKTKLENSITYLIHGDRVKWEGNVAYNDGHVNFEIGFTGTPKEDLEFPYYEDKERKHVRDCLFFDETDSKEPTKNLFLGIFTMSGKEVIDWKSIWD